MKKIPILFITVSISIIGYVSHSMTRWDAGILTYTGILLNPFGDLIFLLGGIFGSIIIILWEEKNI